MLVAFSLTNVVPSFWIETTGRSFAVSRTCCVLGTSTGRPYSITWAVSMKMMSSTSTTSTNGVTLISARGAPPRPPRRDREPPPLTENAMLFSETAFGHVEELECEIVHARADVTDASAESVVGDGRRNGGEQADRGGIERLRNAGSDGSKTGAALRAERIERADN